MKYLLVIPGILLIGCTRESQPAVAVKPKAMVVRAELAAAIDWPVIYEATGTVRARATATVSSRWMAAVREVKVQVGDRVRQGQTLIVLDGRDLDSGIRRAEAARTEVKSSIPETDGGVAAAQASLDLAQSTYNRMQDLFQKKSISNQEFDESSARLKAARASLDMAKAKRTQLDARLAQTEQEVRSAEITRSFAEITAPFNGIVVTKTVDPGSMAVPGAPLLTLERDGAFRLEASVDELHLLSVRAGQVVIVTLDGIESPLSARVSGIVPAIDAATRSGIVKIDLPAVTGLRSGQFGRSAFATGKKHVLAVPTQAIVTRGQLQSLFVVDNGFARSRMITLGGTRDSRHEVLSGLSEKELVIAPVPSALVDGSPVEVAK